MTEARTLVAGEAKGPALLLDEPLSFWGGVDPATGDIVDVHHPQRDANVAGRVLVMPSGRGSSSSSSVLAECIRAGTAPVAIVLGESDPILALGAIVARELYGRTIPVVVVEDGSFRTGELVTIRAEADSVRID
jgi:predicted aconitase with swiveling domain